MGKLKALAEITRYYSSFINQDLAKIYSGLYSNKIGNINEHLEAAATWICRAQDATNDNGVARSYSLVYNPYFKKKGWIASYPETTGYIIPTIFDYAHFSGNQEYYDRALRMALSATLSNH